MKIKKLQIVGFKSFVDQTTVHFDHDITCVVGPNGCGKSNIVDAIKWCMGEQSAARLRGKHMEDVIFSGAEGRGPHGFAEVTLTFDNTDGLAPPDYSDYAEIQVARRLDRQGNSDYFINRTPVRLLDITNLFLGTGVGKRAYSIIEQGRIGYIVTSKPEDRRSMIEEAAGISKFKLSKRAAERKMDQTRQNLLRVTDIIGELERSLASLKRQAQKAERYKRYKKEMRDLDLWVASHRFLELRGQISSSTALLSKANEDVQASRHALVAKEASVEAERVSLQQLGSDVERGQGRAYELDNLVRQLEGLIRQQQDRQTALVERKELATRELRQLEEQRDDLHQEASTVRLSLSELEALEAEAGELLAAVEAELQTRKNTAEEAEVCASERPCSASGRAHQGGGRRGGPPWVRRATRRHSCTSRALAGRAAGACHTRCRVHAATRRVRGADGWVAQRKVRDCGAPNRDRNIAVDRTRTRCTRQTQRSTRSARRFAVTSSRLRSLNEIHERFEGVGAGAQAVMTGYASTSGDAAGSGGSGGSGRSSVWLPTAWSVRRSTHARWALRSVARSSTCWSTIPTLPCAPRTTWLRGEKGRATFLPRSPERSGANRAAVPRRGWASSGRS